MGNKVDVRGREMGVSGKERGVSGKERGVSGPGSRVWVWRRRGCGWGADIDTCGKREKRKTMAGQTEEQE